MKLALCALLLAAIPPVPVIDAVVVGVVDGDTLRVWVDGEVRMIHVAGIDAPNLPRPRRPVEYYGPEAARFVREVTWSRKVRLRPDLWLPGGGSGREMYVQLSDGRDLGTELVRRGMAYALRGCERCAELRVAERTARANFTGLWNPDTHRAFILSQNRAVLVGMPGYGRLAPLDVASTEPAKPVKAERETEKKTDKKGRKAEKKTAGKP